MKKLFLTLLLCLFPLSAWADYDVDFLTGGTASANEYHSAGYEADKAFDDDFTTTRWVDVGGSSFPDWLKYDLGVAVTKTAEQYTITCNYAVRSPRDFLFQGSNNDSDWDDLDTQVDVTGWTGMNTFTFSNSTAYRYYRLYITDNNGDAYNDITEIEAMETLLAVAAQVISINEN